MLNAPAGVVRAIARLRPTSSEPTTRSHQAHRRSWRDTWGIGARIATFAHLAHLAPRPSVRPRPIALRRTLAVRLGSERTLPVLAALVVLAATLVSFQPAAARATGSTSGDAAGPRIAIGGGAEQLDPAEVAALKSRNGLTPQDAVTPVPSYADDGTLYKPVAVDTSIQDARSLLQIYTVQSGDTLTGIANHFGLSMMTIWWANKLTAKDQLHVGQQLVIPPMDGLVVTVGEGDTLDSLAAKYHVDASAILAANQLSDSNLIIGQVLILPDATGAPIPTTAPVITRRATSGGTSSCSSCTSRGSYTGGRFLWPVVGGNNYISQYYHYGHWAIDIAAEYGTKVVAAARGTVVFAGWKSNGGGWQVWISHGSNLFTTYNHMSAITVSAGQSVARGQQVGRVGMSGDATGPHLHFEVWIGPIWNGGTRVNPLRYF